MWKPFLFWIINFLIMENVLTLKNVVLTIEPRVVQRFSSSMLRCSYDLENDSLYSVKWYRGTKEFYRYTPKERPKTMTFPISGITVDNNNSNSTQVVLKNIDFPLSGNFTCEVTTDEPFSTGSDTQFMQVVELPEYPPTISVTRKPLDYGDILRANCSCSPSRPRATLTFLLNNYTVAQSEPLSYRQTQEKAWSDLNLEMELSEFHFTSGKLILQCVADVASVYREEAVLKLDSARDPVPERVSAYDAADINSSSMKLLVVIFILFYV